MLKRTLSITFLFLLLLPATAMAQPEYPASLVLIMDTSRSLDTTTFNESKALAQSVISNLSENDEVAVYGFNDLPVVAYGFGSDFEQAAAVVDSLTLGGNYSTFYDTLITSSKHLGTQNTPLRMILTMTDGLDEGSSVGFDAALEQLDANGIKVFSVAVGRTKVLDPLRRMSKLSGGQYFGTPDASLAAGLVAEMKRITRASLPEPEPVVDKTPAPVLERAPVSISPKVFNEPLTLDNWKDWMYAHMDEVFYGGLVLGTALIGLGYLLIRRRKSKTPADDIIADVPAPNPLATVIMRKPEDKPVDRTQLLTQRAYLSMEIPGGKPVYYPLKVLGSTSIGRSDVNEIVLSDVTSSSQHCRVDHRPDGFRLYDMKSTNGTFLNGEKIDKAELTGGDKIKAGKTIMTFVVDQTGSFKQSS